jgi:serine/threonine protein kinase
MITGSYAIWSDNTTEILHQVAYGARLEMSRLPKKLPKEIHEIIKRCTEKKPKDRYTNSKELLNEIRRLSDKKC